MSDFLACKSCHEVVIKSIGTEIKIRAKVLLIRDGNTFAVCKGCNAELAVPLRFDLDLAKSLLQSGPRLYLKK